MSEFVDCFYIDFGVWFDYDCCDDFFVGVFVW